MERDSAITVVRVLAVLELVGAGFGFLLSILFLIGGPLLAASIVQEDPALATIGSAFLGVILIVLGVFFLILAVLSLLSGIGLWRMRNWGRILSLIGSWFSILWCVLNLVGLLRAWPEPGALASFIGNLFGLAVSAAWVWLLQFQPDIVAVFKAPLPTAVPARARTPAKKRRK